jgi:NADH dehydrogenase/NADH:ubiquinone oxidoreductase subunit G
MKCKYVQQHLLDYSESQLDRKTHAQIEEHLRDCAACRKELKDFEQTVELLQSSGIEAPPERFWEEFSSGVMRKVRRMDTPSRQLGSLFFPNLKMATIALATLAVILGAALLYTSGVLQSHFSSMFKGKAPMLTARGQQSETQLEALFGELMPDEMFEEILESDFALLDSEGFSGLSLDSSETSLYLSIESLNDEEKMLLRSELEDMREELRKP